MEVDKFEAETETFLSWLSQIGVRLSPKIQIADFREKEEAVELVGFFLCFYSCWVTSFTIQRTLCPRSENSSRFS